MQYRGKRVTVMGLGHFGGGSAAARWLAQRGARVTVTDRADERTLAGPLAGLAGVPIEAFHLGGHRKDDFRDADLVVVNPAVRPGDPWLDAAKSAGVPLTTEIGLLLDELAGPTIGVTGSNGKSTTAAMTAQLLRHAGRRAWLGGNLGGSLLGQIENIRADDWVVLELSSFQLAHLPSHTPMPRIAVVTNCTPNHLDWHGDWRSYVAAKQRILKNPSPASRVVLGRGLDSADGWHRLAGDRRIELPRDGNVGLVGIDGNHNRENAVCAFAAAVAAGCDRAELRDALASFTGLPGRMEYLKTVAGRRLFNDTTSTTPESTIAAIEVLGGEAWLLVGGGDKGVDFGKLIDAIALSVRGVAFYGEVGPRLHARLGQRSPGFAASCHATMAEALSWCFQRSRPGESIVLSPACTSHDQFRNFVDRGEKFVELVSSLAARTLSPGKS
ncbi:MAG: UDP-N-acetylmuramoyl-L-alanine--D-glutamate ligase [Pirellulales bacterium]|nr:UDP-N-acetylmuramoyl-L-alanine--D-glutamate ligase [Pirellulales bacterium]